MACPEIAGGASSSQSPALIIQLQIGSSLVQAMEFTDATSRECYSSSLVLESSELLHTELDTGNSIILTQNTDTCLATHDAIDEQKHSDGESHRDSAPKRAYMHRGSSTEAQTAGSPSKPLGQDAYMVHGAEGLTDSCIEEQRIKPSPPEPRPFDMVSAMPNTAAMSLTHSPSNIDYRGHEDMPESMAPEKLLVIPVETNTTTMERVPVLLPLDFNESVRDPQNAPDNLSIDGTAALKPASTTLSSNPVIPPGLNSPTVSPERSSPILCPSSPQSVFVSSSPKPSSPFPASSPPSSPPPFVSLEEDIPILTLADIHEVSAPKITDLFQGSTKTLLSTDPNFSDNGNTSLLPSPERSEGTMLTEARQTPNQELGKADRQCEKLMQHVPPNPKRPTAAAQRKQREKLSQPFCPPRLISPKSRNRNGPLTTRSGKESAGKAVEETEMLNPAARTPCPKTREVEKRQQVVEIFRNRHRTARAAVQFRSPLTADDKAHATSAIRLTPTIQVLERKLQILKRAVKIKQDGEEGVLRALVTKWTEVGREVAWEVWALVRENVQDNPDRDRSAINGKRPFQDGWCWETQGGKQREMDEGTTSFDRTSDEQRGTDISGKINLMNIPVDSEDLDEPRHTLGTMLRQLGIDPQTLAWDDAEEAFKDIDDVK